MHRFPPRWIHTGHGPFRHSEKLLSTFSRAPKHCGVHDDRFMLRSTSQIECFAKCPSELSLQLEYSRKLYSIITQVSLLISLHSINYGGTKQFTFPAVICAKTGSSFATYLRFSTHYFYQVIRRPQLNEPTHQLGRLEMSKKHYHQKNHCTHPNPSLL